MSDGYPSTPTRRVRTQPMTPEEVVPALNRHHGLHLVLEGKARGGESGAYLVRADGDRRRVLKWRSRETLPRLEVTVRRVERLRDRGYPAPHHRALAIPGAAVLLQDAAEGTVEHSVDRPLLDEVLRLVDLQEGLGDGDDDRPWADYLAETLLEGADGYCLHEPLRTYNDETRRLLGRVHEVGRSVPDVDLPDGDLVHLDLHHLNILRRDGDLAAVIDWDGCRTGDRVFDLVTFGFGLYAAQRDPDLDTQLWRRVRELRRPDVVRVYAAHMALRLVDWQIRHHGPDEVALWMDASERLFPS